MAEKQIGEGVEESHCYAAAAQHIWIMYNIWVIQQSPALFVERVTGNQTRQVGYESELVDQAIAAMLISATVGGDRRRRR